ncbi:transcription factor with AP2 domain(s), putative [Plasmodium vinckei brucechwatti]|uniref:Transcription factor with AP2 domain(S), putative n=1 Tax=Plasmodium vinckei brucechwatti TaxID=119398 RepID=A0A6V7RUJ7_PLAVN|nr:transcription factor with AP2 domain(s), putative [Plasmodium vinckei brucechwatti]
MLGRYLMNNKPYNKFTYIIISHATNLEILNKNFSTFVQCKINPPSLFGLAFSYDKKFFGVKRVVQKRKYMLKLIQPHQECFDAEKYKKYLEKEKLREKIDINNINIDNEKEVELYEDYLLNYKYNKREVEKNAILPLSLLSSSFIRRAIYSNRENILKNLKNINWKRYCCNVKGVRWHASGAWRVYFCKRNYQHNFFVKCDCYFRVSIYGFEKSKELAVLYRKRLEYEYILLMKRWKEIEMENAKKRKIIKESAKKYNDSDEEQEDDEQTINSAYNNEN